MQRISRAYLLGIVPRQHSFQKKIAALLAKMIGPSLSRSAILAHYPVEGWEPYRHIDARCGVPPR